MKYLLMLSSLLTLVACQAPSVSNLPTPETENYTLETLSGAEFGFRDGNAALYYHPNGLAASNETLFIADRQNNRIRKLSLNGEAQNFVGSDKGNRDGQGDKALLNLPLGMAFNSEGTLFFTDTNNHTVRQANAEGLVSTFVGNGSPNYSDNTGEQAELNWPAGIAFDQKGNLFVADRLNHAIRKITPEGAVSTFAGNGEPGLVDATGKEARFAAPIDLVFDSDGNLLVADSANHALRKITPTGEVSTLSHPGGEKGFSDGALKESLWHTPSGLTLDPEGNIYVSDRFNHRIRKITPEGNVSTIAGNGEPGFADGEDSQVSFPFDILYHKGHLYIADHGNHKIRKLKL